MAEQGNVRLELSAAKANLTQAGGRAGGTGPGTGLNLNCIPGEECEMLSRTADQLFRKKRFIICHVQIHLGFMKKKNVDGQLKAMGQHHFLYGNMYYLNT